MYLKIIKRKKEKIIVKYHNSDLKYMNVLKEDPPTNLSRWTVYVYNFICMGSYYI